MTVSYRFPDRVEKVALAAALAPLDAPGVMAGMSPMASGLYAPAQSERIEEFVRRHRFIACRSGGGHVGIRHGVG